MGQTEEIIHRQLDTDTAEPAIAITMVVADIEGEDPGELPTVWDCIDGALDEIFSDPPAPEAQLEVSYTYYGYRITVDQSGHLQLVRVEDSK